MPTLKAHIYCSAGITPQFHDVFVRFVLNQPKLEALEVYLSSGGGNPFIGFNLYGFLKSRIEKTTVYNMGNVDSAAVQFFLGFQTRYAVPHSTFLMHPTTYQRDILPASFTQADARRVIHELGSIELKTEQIMLEETAGRGSEELTPDMVRTAVEQTTVVTAENALRFGIIDGVKRPEIPKEGVMWITEEFLGLLRNQPPQQPPPTAT